MNLLAHLGASKPYAAFQVGGVCSSKGARRAACMRYITGKTPHIGQVPAIASIVDRTPVIGSTRDQEAKDASLTPA